MKRIINSSNHLTEGVDPTLVRYSAFFEGVYIGEYDTLNKAKKLLRRAIVQTIRAHGKDSVELDDCYILQYLIGDVLDSVEKYCALDDPYFAKYII